MDEYTELTQEERAAFEALPRERMPATRLEQRTVRALRARGLLNAPKPWIPVSWRIAAGIAALALFGGGVALGQQLGPRAASLDPGVESALRVQQAGTAFVEAMADAAEAGATDPEAAAQAREVAVTSFHTIANSIVQFAPDDPVVLHVLRGLERARYPATQADGLVLRHIVWF